MRILQMHCDWIEFEPIKKEIQTSEDFEKKKYKYENVLVLFTAVEEGDNESVADKAVTEAKEFLQNLKVNKILIYPFSHLSNNLAKPSMGLSLVKRMMSKAKDLEIETYNAPFGWTKSLSMQVKGHPLAEQSRVYVPGKEVRDEDVSEAVKAERRMKSTWFIISTNGQLSPVETFDFSKNKKLEKLANYEMAKSRMVQQQPPHVKMMKQMELVDNEPASDPGNLRFYPKGRLIKSLLETFVTDKVIDYGGMEVETPIMYDFEHPSLSKYLSRFPARQYQMKSEDRRFFLRFSACFGQFLIAHDSQISYKQLPYRIYELTRYSFRREQSGELTGLRRLRAFTMPDVHTLVADMNQAQKEFVTRFKLSQNVLEGCGLEKDDYELAIRFTKDFFEKNKKFIESLIKLHGKPALVEIWDELFFYFVLKYEFNFIDNLGKAAALSTDQIDIENGERFGITFVDEKGQKNYPLILHCSPSGAIERIIYALLEKNHEIEMMKKTPHFPLWLSPTQVRLVPVSDKFNSYCEKIAEKFSSKNVRVDIDDRRETVQKKIREAELEWVPAICVIGEKEVKSKKLSVRFRGEEKIQKMTTENLIKLANKETEGKPFKQLSLPRLLSKRPIFVG